MSGSQVSVHANNLFFWEPQPGSANPSLASSLDDEDAYLAMLFANEHMPTENCSGLSRFMWPSIPSGESTGLVQQQDGLPGLKQKPTSQASNKINKTNQTYLALNSAAIDPALSSWPGISGATVDSQPQAHHHDSPRSSEGVRGELATSNFGACGRELSGDEWTYAVQVWPAADTTSSSDIRVSQHCAAIDNTLRSKNIEFSLRLVRAPPGGPEDFCRLYSLAPHLRDHNRARLDFLFAFGPNRSFNRTLKKYRHKMTVTSLYEPKGLMHPDGLYTGNINNGNQQDNSTGISSSPRRHQNDMSLSNNHTGDLTNGRFSPLHDMHELEAFNNDEPTLLDPSSPSPSLPFLGPPTPEDALTLPTLHKPEHSSSGGTPAPPRMKPIPKPDREVMKTRDGKYRCTAIGCTEEVKEFSRKCEWSKHMDKHDRPYKCPAEGCEKLPGFTYSGGLLRHEREVHGKHGGPKNPLNCPHVNCKRHDGKGFSRLENLNEHLRRVHTSSAIPPPTASSGHAVSDDREDSVSVVGSDKVGEKRKAPVDDELQQENKRLRTEIQSYQARVLQLEKAKQDLEHEIAARNQVSMAMMNELRQLRERQSQAQSAQLSSFEPGRLTGGNMLEDDGDDSLLSVQHL